MEAKRKLKSKTSVEANTHLHTLADDVREVGVNYVRDVRLVPLPRPLLCGPRHERQHRWLRQGLQVRRLRPPVLTTKIYLAIITIVSVNSVNSVVTIVHHLCWEENHAPKLKMTFKDSNIVTNLFQRKLWLNVHLNN